MVFNFSSKHFYENFNPFIKALNFKIRANRENMAFSVTECIKLYFNYVNVYYEQNAKFLTEMIVWENTYRVLANKMNVIYVYICTYIK